MRQFRDTLNLCGLKEIHLQNRKVTWSNHRANPTLVRLDRVFCNLEWDTTFNSHIMQALSSAMSDHCPLLLSSQKDPPRPWHFSLKISGYPCRASKRLSKQPGQSSTLTQSLIVVSISDWHQLKETEVMEQVSVLRIQATVSHGPQCHSALRHCSRTQTTKPRGMLGQRQIEEKMHGSCYSGENPEKTVLLYN